MNICNNAKSSWGKDLDLKCDNNKIYGYIFRISAKNDKLIRNNPKVIILSVQKLSGVLFTTKGNGGLQDANERYSEIKKEYESLQSSLIKEILEETIKYTSYFEKSSSILSHLDVIVSFSLCVKNAKNEYICPEIKEMGNEIEIMESRHPILECQDDIEFINNNYSLNKKNKRFLIISGPNMGGKSTYIRELGILIVMSQIGSYIPASKAVISIIDSIYARIGAGDIQLKGISTFMSEMVEASNILKCVNENSLIIIDELGRGTSTYDGFGLAWSISKYIIKEKKCYCLFATHFHEMCDIEDEDEKVVVNLHVSGIVSNDGNNNENITMLYNIENGRCDESYGINVGLLTGFPVEVIESAKRKGEELSENKNKMRKLIKFKEDNLKNQEMLKKFVKLNLNAEITNNIDSIFI